MDDEFGRFASNSEHVSELFAKRPFSWGHRSTFRPPFPVVESMESFANARGHGDLYQSFPWPSQVLWEGQVCCCHEPDSWLVSRPHPMSVVSKASGWQKAQGFKANCLQLCCCMAVSDFCWPGDSPLLEEGLSHSFYPGSSTGYCRPWCTTLFSGAAKSNFWTVKG